MPELPPPAAPTAARLRCPRCGARLGRLAADTARGVTPTADPAAWYCGCCGLVTAGAAAPAGRC